MVVRLNFSSQFSVILAIAAITIVSCGGSEPEETAIEPDSSLPEIQGEPLESAAKIPLEAGAYCYRTEAETLQAIAELLVEPDQSVTGTLEATVTDDENAYYTSYNQNFAGVLEGDELTASVTTKIEDDTQESTETWTLNQNQFSSDSAVLLKRVDCEEIIALKSADKNPEKPVAAAPTSTPAPPKPAPVTAPTQSQPTNPQPPNPQPPNPQPKAVSTATSPVRIQFNDGASQTVVKGSLAANQTQVYLINAQEGQDMYLDITNGSGAAIFDVEVENGEVIQEDLPEFLDFTLPFSGDYIVTVKAQENNTSYALSITVQ